MQAIHISAESRIKLNKVLKQLWHGQRNFMAWFGSNASRIGKQGWQRLFTT
jgi:hypothetical protein